MQRKILTGWLGDACEPRFGRSLSKKGKSGVPVDVCRRIAFSEGKRGRFTSRLDKVCGELPLAGSLRELFVELSVGVLGCFHCSCARCGIMSLFLIVFI